MASTPGKAADAGPETRVGGPEVTRRRRSDGDLDAPTALSIDKARVGRELSADPLPYAEDATTEAMRRNSAEKHEG